MNFPEQQSYRRLGFDHRTAECWTLGRALGRSSRARRQKLFWIRGQKLAAKKWLTFTNGFSIENKRLIHAGGYSNDDDPQKIWVNDDIAKENNMEQWLATATEEKREAHQQFYKSLVDPQSQLMSRMKQWDITMDPMWMAEYEDPELIKFRMSLRHSILECSAGDDHNFCSGQVILEQLELSSAPKT
jgi:hypothetical protein